jgi:hypothetical protein
MFRISLLKIFEIKVELSQFWIFYNKFYDSTQIDYIELK